MVVAVTFGVCARAARYGGSHPSSLATVVCFVPTDRSIEAASVDKSGRHRLRLPCWMINRTESGVTIKRWKRREVAALKADRFGKHHHVSRHEEPQLMP